MKDANLWPMEKRAPQKRRQETRAKLIAAAEAIIATDGFSGLRVEDVVARAQVAKGTFFSHFADKDRLMALIIGQEMERILGQMADAPPPTDIDTFAVRLAPLMDYMAQDRFVFDVVMRFSGAGAIETTELISHNFMRQVELFVTWIYALQGTVIRTDVDPVLLAEGIQAFAVQAMALKLCALDNTNKSHERLVTYLKPWLAAPK
ncbi:TetR/AcrR family transcriptional regulator [Yoonia sp. BS5-3]|uniref:TetR/AcrR family transcriptional regulator n=1 Tax=Yoonia phaeophyticola TaxID=3137369 RepID=A0ABZ2V4H6_9RHOB